MSGGVNQNSNGAGLANAALGLGATEGATLAGKNIDLNGDGQISKEEIDVALKAAKKDGESDRRTGAPNLRLVNGGNNPGEVPPELVGTEKTGARKSEDRTELPFADLSYKSFDREIFERIRVSMAKTGQLPNELAEPGEQRPLEVEVVAMGLKAIRDGGLQWVLERSSERDLVGRVGPSFRRNAA